MVSNDLMPPQQHAYQQSKSCINAWTDVYLFVNMSLDKGKMVAALMLDMSAAFNLVLCTGYLVIIPKLQMLGIGKYALRLFEYTGWSL